MTEQDPESTPDDASEGDLVDQHTDIGDDLDTYPDAEPAEGRVAGDSWDADVADVADQQAVAGLGEEE